MSENKCPNLCCGNMQRIAELEAERDDSISGMQDRLNVRERVIGDLEAENAALRERIIKLEEKSQRDDSICIEQAETIDRLREQLEELQAKQPVCVGYVTDDSIRLLCRYESSCSMYVSKENIGSVLRHPIYIDPQQEVKG